MWTKYAQVITLKDGQDLAKYADLADTKVVIRVQQPSGWVYTFQRLVAGGDFVSLALLPI